MTWRGRIDDTTFVIEDRWVSPTRLEWVLTRHRAGGARVQEIRGVLTRADRGARSP